MLEEANSKRRKLEREKRKMDRPKDGELLSALEADFVPCADLRILPQTVSLRC